MPCLHCENIETWEMENVQGDNETCWWCAVCGSMSWYCESAGNTVIVPNGVEEND